MSYFDYQFSKVPVMMDAPFYGLIMAAMRRADTLNAARLRHAFPEVWEELQARYNAPGAILPGENPPRMEEGGEDTEEVGVGEPT